MFAGLSCTQTTRCVLVHPMTIAEQALCPSASCPPALSIQCKSTWLKHGIKAVYPKKNCNKTWIPLYFRQYKYIKIHNRSQLFSWALSFNCASLTHTFRANIPKLQVFLLSLLSILLSSSRHTETKTILLEGFAFSSKIVRLSKGKGVGGGKSNVLSGKKLKRWNHRTIPLFISLWCRYILFFFFFFNKESIWLRLLNWKNLYVTYSSWSEKSFLRITKKLIFQTSSKW